MAPYRAHRRTGRTATVSVKVDTGLNRNGVLAAQFPSMLTALRQAVAEAAGIGEAIEFEREVARRDAAAAAARCRQVEEGPGLRQARCRRRRSVHRRSTAGAHRQPR